MNILFVTKNLPYPLDDGSNLRLYNIVKHLSEKHDLYLLSLVNKPECKKYETNISNYFKMIYYTDIPEKKLNIFKKKWHDHIAEKKSCDVIEKIILKYKIDVAHMHYQIPAKFTIKRVSHLIPVVTDFVDSMSLYHVRRKVKLSVFNLPNIIRKIINIFISNNIEKYVMQYTAVSLAVSSNDIESLRKNSPNAVFDVIANGVDTEYFDLKASSTKSSNSDEKNIVFIGNMDFPPNIDAVTYFVNEIFPSLGKKNINFKIVGKNPVLSVKNLAKYNGVQVLGYVDDVRDYYSEATIVVIPMVSGGGIKNKVLEAFAMGKTVISTSLGVEAINCFDNEHLLIADTPELFSEKIINILDDEERQPNLGENARKLVVSEYSWGSVAHKLESIYERLVFNRE